MSHQMKKIQFHDKTKPFIDGDGIEELFILDPHFTDAQANNYTVFQSVFSANQRNMYLSLPWWYRGFKWIRFHVSLSIIILAFVVLTSIVAAAQTTAPVAFKPSQVFESVSSQSIVSTAQTGFSVQSFSQCNALGGNMGIDQSNLVCVFGNNKFIGPRITPSIQPESQNLNEQPIRLEIQPANETIDQKNTETDKPQKTE